MTRYFRFAEYAAIGAGVHLCLVTAMYISGLARSSCTRSWGCSTTFTAHAGESERRGSTIRWTARDYTVPTNEPTVGIPYVCAHIVSSSGPSYAASRSLRIASPSRSCATSTGGRSSRGRWCGWLAAQRGAQNPGLESPERDEDDHEMVIGDIKVKGEPRQV